MHSAMPRGGGPVVPHPHLRITNQDREQVVEQIKTAYAEGRLDKEEMDERLDLAMNARTHGDLAPIVRDLRPAGYVPRPAPAGPGYPPPCAGSADGGERVCAAAAHLLALCGLLIVGPVLMLLLMGKTSPYVRRHAIEALNFHITLLGATILLPITLIGIPLIPVMWVVAVVLWIVAGLAALGEGDFKYPFTLRLIR
jgi:Uncharacterized protein conserved in bacteria